MVAFSAPNLGNLLRPSSSRFLRWLEATLASGEAAMGEDNKPSGPDLTQGVSPADFSDGKLLGHVGDEQVLLVQLGAEVLAIDAFCSHYHGPLTEGLVVGDTIRCPWHHACFSVHTGEAEGAPALNPLSCFEVRRQKGRLAITGNK